MTPSEALAKGVGESLALRLSVHEIADNALKELSAAGYVIVSREDAQTASMVLYREATSRREVDARRGIDAALVVRGW